MLWIRLWIAFEPGAEIQFRLTVPWIETLGVGYLVGVDGLSLPLLLLTALLFFFALVLSKSQTQRLKEYYAWFLFLEMACLGVFAALDLFLFFVFWDLTLVSMYFIIAIWGHEQARAAAMGFFIYTFVGSLALLLGIIGLYLASTPYTMDMAAIISRQPLSEGGWLAHLVFFSLLIGLGIKTPVVPLHTWLPPAHGEAPTARSSVLAGVLLKMGTYGFVRIMLPMLPETVQTYAWLIVLIGVVSVIYGALVALAQTNLKRLIAYTSVNHMGYVILAIGAAAMLEGDAAARTLAVNGAVLQMVSHGLITGTLFLLAGVIWERTHTFELSAYGGLAKATPVLASAFSLAAFASLGLPGLSGFVAEFQIFVGVFGIYPVAAVVALVGIAITAALFLWTLQRIFLGPLNPKWSSITDMALHERIATFPLLALVVIIGLLPMWLLEVIDGFSQTLIAILQPAP